MDLHATQLHCQQLLQAGRLAEAEAACRAALAATPGQPGLLNLLGVICQHGQRPGEAESAFREALRLAPHNAGLHLNLGHLRLAQGAADEALALYRRAVELQPGLTDAHFSLARACAESGRTDEARTHFEAALGLDPERAEVRYRYAVLLRQLGRLDEARRELERCAARLEHADVFALLGAVALEQGRAREAEGDYRRALALDPRRADAQLGLGAALRATGRFDEALAAYAAALQARPDYAEAWSNLASLQRDLGRLDEALQSHQCALAIDPDNPRMRFAQAGTLLLAGRFEEGWEAYEWRWQGSPQMRARQRRFACPQWRGEPMAGRRILLHCEQGFGDAIQFIRYAPLVKRLGAQVVVECPPELLRLFRSVAGIDELLCDAGEASFDLHCPLMSLPRLLQTRLDSIPARIPYLAPAQDDDRPTLPDASGQLHIGIVWRGGALSDAGDQRNCPLEQFEALLRLQGARFFSLQLGAEPAERERLAALGVTDLSGELRDFAVTAAAIEQLDLVIAVDTAVAHLAGALGKPVWLANRANCDWRWLTGRDDSPWYPTLRQFRQTRPGEWGSVIGRLAVELARLEAGEARLPQLTPDSTVDYLPPQVRAPADEAPAATARRQCRHGEMRYFRQDRYVGRSLALYGEFSEGEVALFAQVVRPGDTVLEAGANIGAHSVALARMAGADGRLLAYEPQREVYALLAENLAANRLPQAEAHHAALGAAPGEIRVPPLDYTRTANVGGVTLGGEAGELVPVATVDGLALEQLRLLKVDVEGMEIEVLRGALDTIGRLRPILYVENDRRASSPALIGLIQSLGYRLWWHLPPLFLADNFAGVRGNIFGRTLSINLLCVPREAAGAMSGLREIQRPDDWYA